MQLTFAVASDAFSTSAGADRDSELWLVDT